MIDTNILHNKILCLINSSKIIINTIDLFNSREGFFQYVPNSLYRDGFLTKSEFESYLVAVETIKMIYENFNEMNNLDPNEFNNTLEKIIISEYANDSAFLFIDKLRKQIKSAEDTVYLFASVLIDDK